jgi:putative addiction module killer protein
MLEYQIKIYETLSKKCPFNKWLNGLSDKEAQVAIDLRIERLKLGNFGQCKSLGGGIYELKFDVGPGHRIYFGKIGLRVILLLCAGDKSSQQSDITKAKKYFQDFKLRGL